MKNLIKNIRFYVETMVLVMGVLLVSIILIYTLMNWPSVWQRLNFQTKLVVEASNINETGAEPSVWSFGNIGQTTDWPQELLVKAEIWKLYKENIGQKSDNFLYIPALNVEAPLQYLEKMDDEEMKLKLKAGVVHYPQTALPGEKGNVFIFGHSSYYWWDDGSYNTIFANLENINIGDKVLVYFDKQLLIYEVREKKVVEANDLSVLNQGESHQLSLMTCTPLGTDLRRFVAVAELVN